VVPDAAATGLAGGEPHILIDGYRCVAALRRLGRDRALVECWACDVAQALLGVLARSRSRSFAAIEEALLLRELTQGLGLSQLEVARRCGRNDSWVNRRLQLLSALPDAALAAVRDGRLSTWSASRVIAPLARASAQHAERLLAALLSAPISTRELRQWFEHYQKARRSVRVRMVDHPQLFLQAINESSEQEISDRLRDGPEGECELDLGRINGLIRRVRQRLPMLCPLSERLVGPCPAFRPTSKPSLTTSSGMVSMIGIEIRNSVRILKAQGQSLREISRQLKLSRNTVRRILRVGEHAAEAAPPCDEKTLARLKDAFERARGNGVRVQELLADEDGLKVPYSTLTRWIREAELRPRPRRSGEYQLGPGQEMQHDSSQHRVVLARKRVAAQCAGLVLAYSRRLYFRYYPRFKRFEAKHFLLEATRFNDGSCPACVIDNTSVLVVAGAGAEAVIAPEMVAFARTLGFSFSAHRVRDPDRKGRIERQFAYIENNFLPGRTFDDFEDLNHQALTWCRDVANQKTKRALGMSPEAAYLIEKPYLQPLPRVLPPVYEVLERVVDLYGYVSVETNRYSVPERYVGQSVTVHKYVAEIEIYRHGREIARHPRLIGQHDARHTLPGHHAIPAQRSFPAITSMSPSPCPKNCAPFCVPTSVTVTPY
jgi:transposase